MSKTGFGINFSKPFLFHKSLFIITDIKSNMDKVWINDGEKLYLSGTSTIYDKLENCVYSLNADQSGFFLIKENDCYHFPYKLYSLENELINRIIKTYENTKGNLGILFNGLKGTGKSISSKVICNKLNQPTIIVSNAYSGGHLYLNSIPQDITIFIDEYEKIYKDNEDLLSVMDGALNSDFRRVFLFTTNTSRISSNLLNRPCAGTH